MNPRTTESWNRLVSTNRPYTELAATGPESMFPEPEVDDIVDILNTVKANALPTGAG